MSIFALLVLAIIVCVIVYLFSEKKSINNHKKNQSYTAKNSSTKEKQSETVGKSDKERGF